MIIIKPEVPTDVHVFSFIPVINHSQYTNYLNKYTVHDRLQGTAFQSKLISWYFLNF